MGYKKDVNKTAIQASTIHTWMTEEIKTEKRVVIEASRMVHVS